MASMFTRIFGSYPSVTNSPVKGSNCFDKFAVEVVNNGETVGHLPHKFSKIVRYHFDFILGFWG